MICPQPQQWVYNHIHVIIACPNSYAHARVAGCVIQGVCPRGAQLWSRALSSGSGSQSTVIPSPCFAPFPQPSFADSRLWCSSGRCPRFEASPLSCQCRFCIIPLNSKVSKICLFFFFFFQWNKISQNVVLSFSCSPVLEKLLGLEITFSSRCAERRLLQCFIQLLQADAFCCVHRD